MCREDNVEELAPNLEHITSHLNKTLRWSLGEQTLAKFTDIMKKLKLRI